MTETELQQSKFLDVVIRQGMYSNQKNLANHLKFFFGNFAFKGKRVLDVGGGRGILALWAAASGAQLAVCLEPEADGGASDMNTSFEKLRNSIEIGAERVVLMSTTFQEFSSAEKFDIIILSNSINHLNEPATVKLTSDQCCWDEYLSYFRKMSNLLNAGGRVILTDCDKSNFFSDLGLKSPFMPEIEWEKHQSPKTWRSIMKEAGFHDLTIDWSTPNRLGALGRWALSNRFVAYLLLSHFKLEGTKRASTADR